MKIVGLVGPKGSGKDTAADILKQLGKSSGKISFAGPLKEVCSKVFSVPIQTLNDPDLKERKFVDMSKIGAPVKLDARRLKAVKKECVARVREIDLENQRMKYNIDRVAVNGLEGREMQTPRELLQIIGTDYIRDRIYKRWHVEAAFSDEALAKLTQSGVYCVTDIRFLNEYEYLVEKFGKDFTCYYVERPEKEEILKTATHPSELGVVEIRKLLGEDNVLKNDGTMEDFKSKLADMKEIAVADKPKRGSRLVFGPAKR